MKLNKEKFLKSELGGNLDECVKSWDFAIRGGKEQSRLQTGVKHSGKCIRWRSNSSMVLNIISPEQISILVYVQKMKQIGCLR